MSTSSTDIPPEGIDEHPVSSSPYSDVNRSPPPTIVERSRRKTFDGREVVFVTIETQTDWDWVGKTSHGRQIAPRVKVDSQGVKTDGTMATPFDDKATDNTSYPAPNIDEYGIPLLELSSDNDDYTRESEKEETIIEFLNRQFPGEEDNIQLGLRDSDGYLYGMTGGQCEFCGKTMKAIPTFEQQNNDTPKDIYCCNTYAEFIQFTVTASNVIEDEMRNNQKLINVKVHAHHGDKQEQRAAKERVVQRLRDRDIRKQEATGLQPANFYAFARQMKTINYSLASSKCLEEGWTVCSPSPLTSEEVFEDEPLQLMTSLQNKGLPFMEKFYDNGQKFLSIFDDGTGNILYPSGNVAILITAAEKKHHFIYIIFDDLPDEHSLAIFQPNGHGCCYHPNGVIRVFLDQFGGIELEASGAKKRRWKWIDTENHVHAPPLQPICFALTNYIGIRIMNQDNIVITFSCKKSSCRFNVGSKLKLPSFANLPSPELDDDQIFLEERKNHVLAVLDKVSNLLKFPKSPKIDKILPPIHITSKMHRMEKMKKEQAKQIAARSAQSAKSKKILPTILVN